MSETQNDPQESPFVPPEGTEPEPDTLTHPEGEPAITEQDAAEQGEENAPDFETIEGDDADVGGEQDTDDDEPEQLPPGVAEARLMSERERKARDKALDKERERHAANLTKILGDEAPHLVPCPVCIEAFDGWIFDPGYKQLSTELQLRMRQILGMDEWEDTPQASWAKMCETCNGHGEVKTGSKREGQEKTGCLDCKEAGWHNLHPREESNGNGSGDRSEVTGPTVFGNEHPDPRAQSLRADGWYVAPPVKIGG